MEKRPGNEKRKIYQLIIEFFETHTFPFLRRFPYEKKTVEKGDLKKMGFMKPLLTNLSIIKIGKNLIFDKFDD